MPRVDLGAVRTTLSRPFVPGRLTLSLGQLALVAHRAGDVPLPIELPPAASAAPAGSRLHDRLAAHGAAPGEIAVRLLHRQAATADGADAASLADLHHRSILLDDGAPAGEIVAALRTLADPDVLLVIDVRMGTRRLRSWVGLRGPDAAQLSTAGSADVELGWCAAEDLSGLLARTVTTARGGEVSSTTAGVPDRFDLPFDLFTSGVEAARGRRPDLVEALVDRCGHPVRIDGEPAPPEAIVGLLHSAAARGTGRLRILVTVPGHGDSAGRPVGVVAWTRFDDAWWALRTVDRNGVARIEGRRSAPTSLGAAVAPVLAQVLR